MKFTPRFTLLHIFLCLLLSIFVFGQGPEPANICPSKTGSLLINEVGNQSEGKYGNNAGEFIELLVTSNDIFTPVDVSGFVVDDNHSPVSDNGSTPGHVRLGGCFGEIMPGTIILLYDDQRIFPGIDPAKDGAPNAEGIYQIPFSSDCLVKISDCPVGSNISYNCSSGGGSTIDWGANTGAGEAPKEDWRDYIHLQDDQDVVQVRGSKGLVHALMWYPKKEKGGMFFPDQNNANAVKVWDQSLEDRGIQFAAADHLVAANFDIVTGGYTPGKPNGLNNEEYIEGLQPIICPGSPITIGCPGNSDWCYIWDNDPAIVPQVGGSATVYPTKDRLYIRTTLDGDGNLIGTNSYIVRTLPEVVFDLEEEQLTVGDCPAEATFRFTVLVPGDATGYKVAWSNGSSASSIEVLGDQTHSVTVTAPNGCEAVRSFDAIGDPELVGAVNIEASTSFLCGDDPVQLSATFTNYSGNGNRTYEWSNGATAAVTQITVAGEYRVTVTTTAGCVFSDTLMIDPGFDMVINADSDQACDGNPVHLTLDILGDPGLGLFYEWSTGEYSSDIYVTEGGTYSLNLIQADGCTISASYTVAGGVAMSLVASTDRLVPGEMVDIVPTLNGGTGPYSYTWSSGANSEILSVNIAGTYGLTVTDAAGCTSVDEVEILPFDDTLCDGVDVSIVYHDPDCDNYGSARLESVVSSGFEVSGYEWSTGGEDADLLIDDGNIAYSLTVTTADGCQTVATMMAPDFESMRHSFGEDRFCYLVDHLDIVPLAEDQAILVLNSGAQNGFDDLVAGASGIELEFTAAYEGINGPVFTTIPFLGLGNVPNPATWAGDLSGIPAGTEITVGIEIRTFNLCPISCDNKKNLLFEGATDSVEVILEEDPEILLTDYDCGDEYIPDSTETDITPLQFLNPGEVVTVNGFPILIRTLDQDFSSDGYFSGEGVVPMPWNNKTLLVQFAGKVNKYRVIYNGTVDGIEDQLTNYDYTLGSFSIGSDICEAPIDESPFNEDGIDTLRGLDEWGFVDSTGLHSATGQLWDEYGFDQDGNHVDTEGPYGPNGCSRESRDAEENDCDPVRYVDALAQSFIDSVSAELPDLLTDILAELVGYANDTVQMQKTICNQRRTVMDALIAGNMLNFDRKAIYGDSNQYYNPGLSLRFTEKPKAFQLNIERDANVELLEATHIKLYECDTLELEKIDKHLQLVGLSTPEVQAYILQQLSFLTGVQIAGLNTEEAYRAWLAATITAFAENGGGTQGSVFNGQGGGRTPESDNIDQRLPGVFSTPSHAFSQLGTVAGLDFTSLGFKSREEMLLYELNSEFRQGFQRIQGVHRAHFLDKLHRLQMAQDSSSSSNVLPLAIKKYIGGYEYTILLDGVKFQPGLGPVMNAYMIIKDPESGEKLVFEALNSAFGVGGSEGSRLQLASNVSIRISNAAKLILEPNRTFVDWDCEGFAGMAVGGKIELCRDFITPLDPYTLDTLPDPERFALNFEVYVPEWLDAVVTVDAGAFALTGHENIKWQLDSAIIDLSDRYTPYFVPTEGYTSPHYVDGHLSPLWRGFYLANLSATLPEDLVGSSSDGTTADPVTVGVQDVLIDGKGFTGEAYVEGVDLLNLSDGSAGGWPFSIDRFNVKVIHNGFAGAGFGGNLIIPIFTDTLEYDASIYRHNRFKFTVSPKDSLDMNLFLADATLHPSSKIELGYDYDGFHAVADLTGDIKFKIPSDASVDMTLPELYFKDFRVSNRAPYFEKGVWQVKNLGVSMDFGGFEMDLSRINPYKGDTDGEIGLGFDLAISVGDDLSAGGRFGILGELEEINNRQKWKFKEIDLQGLFIDANIGDKVSIYGALQWYKDDPTYGKGFQGVLDAEFDIKVTSFSVQASAMFGKIDTTKYFFVDAMAKIEGANPAPLQITGFGGGVSYHMSNELNVSSLDIGGSGASNGLPLLGASFSGTTYTVDPTIGLGLKAVVSLATAKKEVFNGWAALELLFNDRQHGGGLNKISIKGQGHFMADVIPKPPAALAGTLSDIANDVDEILPTDDVPDFSDIAGGAAPITAWIDLSYNFNDKVFDGKLEAYMNVAGFVRGAGEKNALVQAAMHVSKDKWYLNVGTPTHPAGIIVDIPLFSAGATAYFNMGTDIPDFPGLPTNVASMAGLINTNEGLRKSGGGIMFGANIYANAGLRAGPVQAFLEASIGFDLMLRDYGDAECVGNPGQRVGLNGWYAAGQSWVYLNGGVKLLGVPIFEAGFAAVMQARLPNPFWAKATMAARIKLLFVEKKVRFDVEIGERCTIVDTDGNEANTDPIINFIEPFDEAKEVATDARPKVFFNYPIDRIFTGPEGESYKATVIDMKLTSLGGGYQLGYQTDWERDKMSVELLPYNLLPANDSIKLEVTVAVLKGNTTEREETQTIVFYTADGYDYIPQTNVTYSYPVEGMYDFYPEEYARQEGFIQLESGQSALLSDLPTGTINNVLLEKAGGEEQRLGFSYDVVSRKISFDLPAGDLSPGSYYKLSLVQENAQKEETEILAPIHFRVSTYNKFNEKLADAANAPAAFGPSIGSVGFIAKKMPDDLLFDDVERLGTGLEEPLVRFRASLLNPYVRQLDDLVNDDFPNSPTTSGCPTFSYAEANQFPTLSDAAGVSGRGRVLVTNEAFASGELDLPENHTQYIRYEVPQEVYRRYLAIEAQVSACIDFITYEFEGEPGTGNATLNTTIRNLLGNKAYNFYQNDGFPSAPNGLYQLRVNYVLPNGQLTTPGGLDIIYMVPTFTGLN